MAASAIAEAKQVLRISKVGIEQYALQNLLLNADLNAIGCSIE
jgi:hypothetical protein